MLPCSSWPSANDKEYSDRLLDVDDWEYLLDILSKRLVELRRTEISKRVEEAVKSYKEGKVKSGKLDELWKDLHD